jgi:dTDP-4-amino-4,6-dideoxygalactose transaminase
MILMNNFSAEPVELREAMIDAVRRVLNSGWYVLGNEVASFERQWAQICGVNFGIGVGNGMDAIEISLRALNIGPGDEVITTPMTAFATVLAILRTGATPVLADINEESALLSVESAQRCLSSRTKAIVLVHLYGQIRTMSVWLEFCRTAGVSLVEDCAQAHFAMWDGKRAGSFGIAGAYSFYPTKNLGAPGDAGMLVTADAAIAERASRIRNYGQSSRYHHTELGMNSRLDELQAAILGVRLKYLAEATDKRRRIAEAYRSGIDNSIVLHLSEPEQPLAHVYHLYVVTTPRRDELLEHLNACGVQGLIHYPIPVHEQPPCKTMKRDPRGLKASEKHASHCLSLPCHPQMTEADVATVIAAVNSFK